jgi:hypothetical protein
MTMEHGEDCSVKVAVHARPLIGDEKLQGCKDCVAVVPGKPQVCTCLPSSSCSFARLSLSLLFWSVGRLECLCFWLYFVLRPPLFVLFGFFTSSTMSQFRY